VDTVISAGEESGVFDVTKYAEELSAAPNNLDVGTSLFFENTEVKVWEVRLDPGDRGPFHSHTRNYFWTVVEPGRALQRFADGTMTVNDYALGETKFLRHTPEDALTHDLENIGESTLRFVTVELLY
jgi:hypothetical protein